MPGLPGKQSPFALFKERTAYARQPRPLSSASLGCLIEWRWCFAAQGVSESDQAQDFLGRLTRSGTETHDLWLDPSIEAVRVCLPLLLLLPPCPPS